MYLEQHYGFLWSQWRGDSSDAIGEIAPEVESQDGALASKLTKA